MRCLFLVALAIVLGPLDSAEPLQLHVAPNGDDAASGAESHPSATIPRPRDEIRQRKPRGALVHVHGGTYRLRDPLLFTPQDSGTAEAPIIYEAVAGETPVFSGGSLIGP